MKPLHIILAVISGAIAGATIGLLFAPDKGSETRGRIAQILKDKGICLKGKKMDELVDELSQEVEDTPAE